MFSGKLGISETLVLRVIKFAEFYITSIVAELIVILFFILGIFNFGNLFTAFLGMLGLKISAYAQPALGRVIDKLKGRKEETE